MSPKKQRKPRVFKKPPEDTKQPRSVIQPDHFQDKPTWSFARCDMSGPFGWDIASKENLIHVMKHLGDLEKSKLSEIFGERHRGNHQPRIDQLGEPAQDRLLKLKLAPERLASLRLTSAERIWAMRDYDKPVLSLLWWDPTHSVFLSRKS